MVAWEMLNNRHKFLKDSQGNLPEHTQSAETYLRFMLKFKSRDCFYTL